MTLISPGAVWGAPENYYLEVLRNPWYSLVARLQHSVSELTVAFWRERGGRTLHLPVTTGSISSPMGLGSDTTPVRVDLAGMPTYLADSMQFLLEFGCRLHGSDCYYVMPSFRGEPVDGSHLNEFFHSEAEIRGGLDDVMLVVEKYLVHLAGGIVQGHADEIRAAGGDVARIERLAAGEKFERLTFDEAAAVVGDDAVRRGDTWRALGRDAEQELLRVVGPFVWVSHWDHLAVPFYQAFAPDDPTVALNADLLFGVGEVVGAGERHVSSHDVRRALELHVNDPGPYAWYTGMRDVSPLRTAGFGMGVERFLMWVLDHGDIRDLQLFPRHHGRRVVP